MKTWLLTQGMSQISVLVTGLYFSLTSVSALAEAQQDLKLREASTCQGDLLSSGRDTWLPQVSMERKGKCWTGRAEAHT